MKKTWKPVVAGILLIASSIPYIVASTRWFVTPGFLPKDMGGGPVWATLGLTIFFPFALPLLAGGICAIIRRAWVMAFVGAVVPLVFTVLLSPWGWALIGTEYMVRSLPSFVRYVSITMVYLLTVVAAILIYLSRSEFKGRRSSAEHLFSAPKRLTNSKN